MMVALVIGALVQPGFVACALLGFVLSGVGGWAWEKFL
jgi:hypothetical protein